MLVLLFEPSLRTYHKKSKGSKCGEFLLHFRASGCNESGNQADDLQSNETERLGAWKFTLVHSNFLVAFNQISLTLQIIAVVPRVIYGNIYTVPTEF